MGTYMGESQNRLPCFVVSLSASQAQEVQIAMRLPIRYSAADGAGDVWALVELQGEIESETGELDGMELGSLSFQNGSPQLRIGNHLLEGKRIQLKKPVAIIRKKRTGADAMEVDAGEALPGVEYEVVSVATEKLIFRHRPKPITSG